MSATIKRTAKFKVKTARSEDYKCFVRTHPCCISICSAGPANVEAHHHGKKGMGQKGSDFTCIPMCRDCHRFYHDHGHFPGMSKHQTNTHAKAVQQVLLSEWEELKALE